MLIAKSIFVDPRKNEVFGIAAISFSMFTFAYSIIFGQITILIFYAFWLPFLVLKPELLLGGLHRVILLLLLPATAVLSTLWSDYPDVTLRGSLQYASTMACGLIAARMVSMETLAKGGSMGSLVVLLYSLAYGGYGYDVIDGTYAFAGAFGSKNSFGFFGSTGLIFAVATIWLFRSGMRWVFLSTVVAGVSTYAIFIAYSTTATITSLIALTVMAASKFSFAFNPNMRRVVLAIGLVAIAGGIAWASATGIFEQLIEVFGKDSTLTGRTYLWREGLKFANERPIAGVGYYAFWVPGRPLAEDLWESFYITSRSGFFFHNTLIESYVELGIIGVLMVGATLLALLVLPLRVLMNRRREGSAVLCVVLAILFVVRSTVEVEFFTPYKLGSFLVPFLLVAMADARSLEIRELRARYFRSHSSVKSDALG